MSQKHTFALFYKNLSQELNLQNIYDFEFWDKNLSHRIFKILRLQVGETITLFDRSINAELKIISSKKNFCGQILNVANNKLVHPQITIFPCLLKKDAFENAIYTATQMAVTKIIPVISTKTHAHCIKYTDSERLTNIMISACEQSKNFIMPELCDPIDMKALPETIEAHNPSIKVYFDQTGENFFHILQKLATLDDSAKNKSNIALLFGPEGGLTIEEEKIVGEASGFITYALTQTILRAHEAIILGIGGIRSVTK